MIYIISLTHDLLIPYTGKTYNTVKLKITGSWAKYTKYSSNMISLSQYVDNFIKREVTLIEMLCYIDVEVGSYF
jgi:hypothetical protein